MESLLEELKRTLDGLGDADLVDSLSEVSTEAPEYGDSEGGGDGDRDSAPSLASDSNHETDQVRMRSSPLKKFCSAGRIWDFF